MCLKNFGKLTKKIYCSLLSGAVLFVLLSMLSKSYCLQLNDTDIANAIYNIAIAQNVILTKNDIDLTICGTIANTYNNNQGKYMISTQYNYNNQIEFYLYNGKAYLASNTVYASNSVSSIRYSIGTKEFVRSSFSSINPSRLGTYYYTDANIYSAYNSNTISIASGTYQPSNFDMFADTLYVNDYFSFNYLSGFSDISVEDFNTMKQIEANFNTMNYVAEFGKYTNLDITTYKPSYTIWKYEKIQDYFEPIITYDYNSYSYVNDDLGYIYLNSSMLIPNTIIEINLKPIDLEEFSVLSILFYITDSNTIITNGSLDIDNTFNDDYYRRYNNIINNIISVSGGQITNPSGDTTGFVNLDPINNSIQNITNSLVSDSYSNFGLTSGDFPTYDIDDPTVNFIDWLINRISNVLLTNEQVYLNISIPYINRNYIVNSDFFVLPHVFSDLFFVFFIVKFVLPKFDEIRNVIKHVQMGYSDAFINYLASGLNSDDLL